MTLLDKILISSEIIFLNSNLIKSIFYKQFANSDITGSGYFELGTTKSVSPGKYCFLASIIIPRLENPQSGDLIGIEIRGYTDESNFWNRSTFYKTVGQQKNLLLSFTRQITSETYFKVIFYTNRNDALYTESYFLAINLDNFTLI